MLAFYDKWLGNVEADFWLLFFLLFFLVFMVRVSSGKRLTSC